MPSEAPSNIVVPAEPESGRRCWARRVAAGLLCVGFFAGCFHLYTRSNDFSEYYHPDERGKYRQLVPTRQGSDTVAPERNYKHPQMLLEATDLALKGLGTPNNQHAVVRVGRYVSAAFAAGAVAALALAGYQIAGFAGLFLAGVAVGLCPTLLAYGHYLKEDTALIFGMALTALAARVFLDVRRVGPRILSLLFLGGAAGVAVSGKYTGVYAIVAAAVLVLAAGPYRKWTPLPRLLPFAIGLAVTVGVINHSALQNYDRFRQALKTETEHAETAHYGLKLAHPGAYHLGVLRKECLPHVLPLAGLFVVLLLVRPKQIGLFDAWIVLYAGGYLVMLCWNVLFQHRYVFPVVVLGYFVAALGALRLGSVLGRRWRMNIVVPALAAGLVLAVQLPRCINYTWQFENDCRNRLWIWVADNLTRSDYIVADASCGLQAPPSATAVPQRQKARVNHATQAPLLGSLDRLRRMGVTHVAVGDVSYGRFFDPSIVPTEDFRRDYQAQREFYERLFAEGELVWEYTPRHNINAFTNPAIRVYRLKDSRPGSPSLPDPSRRR